MQNGKLKLRSEQEFSKGSVYLVCLNIDCSKIKFTFNPKKIEYWFLVSINLDSIHSFGLPKEELETNLVKIFLKCAVHCSSITAPYNTLILSIQLLVNA